MKGSSVSESLGEGCGICVYMISLLLCSAPIQNYIKEFFLASSRFVDIGPGAIA